MRWFVELRRRLTMAVGVLALGIPLSAAPSDTPVADAARNGEDNTLISPFF